jgi:predicted dehydrogenase|tara:strand:- start:1961 stop:2896 length:936 start_codon:yes stop_codon:yes gene_type:complete
MIRIGVLGTGDIAVKHLEVFSELDVEIVATYNRTKSRAEKLSEKFRLGKIYDDYKLMLEENKFDALCVFVASNIIKEVTLDCLDYNVPILMEKPAGISVNQGNEILNKTKEKNIPVMVGFNRRFMSTIMKAKEEIDELISINVEAPERWTQIKQKPKFNKEILASWFYINGCHCLDLMKYFGGKVKTVNSNSEHQKYYRANIEFEKGVLGQYQSVYDNPGNWNVTLITKTKKISLNPLEKISITTKDGNQVHELSELDTKFKPGFFLQNKYFIESIVKNKEQISQPAVGIEEAVELMEFMQKIESDSEANQ